MPPHPNLMRFVLLITLFIGVASSATAQNQTHQVTVRVPDFIGLRIVGAESGPRSVVFDYAADPITYIAAVEGVGSLPPTAVARFDDVQVNATRNGRWSVHVAATPFTYAGPAAPAGLALADVRVHRSGTQTAIVGSGSSAWYLTSWTLSTAGTRIATRTGATGGWQSLGFSGWDYRLSVDGDEAPGTYATVVTYSLTTP